MGEAVVQVKYVNQPKPGKNQGSIKTPDGIYYGVPFAMLGQFQEGGTYRIGFSSRTFRGQQYHTVDQVLKVADAPAPAPATGGRHEDGATAERIFVAGGINNFIAAGKLDIDRVQIATAVNELRAAWAETFGKQQSQGQKPSDDMNDSIPF